MRIILSGNPLIRASTMHSKKIPNSFADRLSTALMIAVGTFVLFHHVLHAGAYSIDVAELALCAWVGGVPHSPGYPLWTRLAQLALSIQDGADPIHAIGRMSAVLAILAAWLTRSTLRMLDVGAWAATGAASLLLIVPLCVRAFSIPEVYALDLFLLSLSIWACQKGSMEANGFWTMMGWMTAILSVGHRPINMILLAVIVFAWSPIRNQSRFVLQGLMSGVVLQSLLYADLWRRINDPSIRWVDEQVQATTGSFLRFIVGLPYERFFSLSGDANHIDPSRLGIQCIGLLLAALLIPLSSRKSRLGWALFCMSLWHLTFILLYQVQDGDFFLFPVLWTGMFSLGLSTTLLAKRFQNPVSAVVSIAAFCLATVNHNGLIKTGHDTWREPLRTTLSQVPPNAIIISDDWPARTRLVAIREMEQIGSTVDIVRIRVDGGDIQRLDEWFEGRTDLLILEEHQEIAEQRPVRVHDDRLLPALIERGMITQPAEGGTWSVSRSVP